MNADTTSSRTAITERYAALVEEASQLRLAGRSKEDGDLGECINQLERVEAEYLEMLSRPAISRCPFTGDKIYHSLDTQGLDGPWWNYKSPVRPSEELPPTFLSLTGSVYLGEEIEEFPFLCHPGPGAPYVVPRVLLFDQVRAVISSLLIGTHQAYLICYFCEPGFGSPENVNLWGTSEYHRRISSGELLVGHAPDSMDDYDFDLEPWVATGKLLWTLPDDPALILHSDVSRCPYLRLPGGRRPLAIQDGIAWDHLEESSDGDSPAT